MMTSAAAWDGQDQHMSSASDDEFHHFLDMTSMSNVGDGMQFDFRSFQDAAPQHMLNQHPQQQHGQPTHAIMGDAENAHAMPRRDVLASQNHAPAMATTGCMPASLLPSSAPSDSISSIDAQIHYLQQQKFQQQQRQLQEQQATFFSQSHYVPPTPQSLEFAPGSGHFFSQAEQVPQPTAYDRGYRRPLPEQQDMAFTPLVSPAVTPLDPHFNMENAFSIPGAYFSPLTSPALYAQNEASSAYDHGTDSNNSPGEMDLEAPAVVVPSAGSSTDLSKKARKNNAVKVRVKSGVKYSPIAKPQRRKTGPSPAIVSQVLNEVEEGLLQPADQSLLPLPATSTEGSEDNASVSPENLTDMPPPPIPSRRSTSRSPYIQAQSSSSQQPTPRSLAEEQQQQQQQQQKKKQQPHPATPASLMKLPASKAKKPLATSHEQHAVTENIESLELPESISGGGLAPINTCLTSPLSRTELSPPRSAPPRQQQQQPLLSPVMRTSGTVSASQSPQLRPGSSGPSARKTPHLASRNSRKRSTSSVHASPALLPRISPNIKPLLPGAPGAPGMSLEDTASRLLMTKSNYQNILEGNTVPGVSYPTELSTNLTSKRTSHKIAEQGRRNRINSALQVMASLLPDQHEVDEGDEGEKKEGKSQCNVPNSKARVVENAIEHMKNLQQENVDLKQELQELKNRLKNLQHTGATTT
ncbi:uncharacterized protein UV8b_02166 [Ustilaginoidea virens]|uniref:BHLH domain-containing protein n=1 Tax=Ustilaginoidea virens TaxID=1159556 RepID=A0A063BR16_USTVR|nr:uncharacterized protein UV8b_02166 [Ustilaginoidea virens]QUC17925.1 hypothetical protein UV8b_02166 [Ustilaginoidea virens]GAO18783.1 hypothetical protein UVI_02052510 [Ustilaginoidea virens]